MKTWISSVAFQGPDGTVAANGWLVFTIQQNAAIIGGGQLYSNVAYRVRLDANGKIPLSPAVTGWSSDELSPQIPYTVNLQDSNGSRLDTFGPWLIVGASPIDLSLMVSTNQGVAFPGVVLLNPGNVTQTISTGNLAITNNETVGGTLLAKIIEGAAYADQFPGASVGAQIDNACASFAGAQGLVIIPSTMGAGNSLVGLPDNCEVWDRRGLSGPNEFANEGVAFLKDNLWRRRWTAAPVSVQNYQTLHLYAEPYSGGTNQTGGPKTNYGGLLVSMASRTPGQHVGVQSFTSNYAGQGDTVALLGYANTSGRNNAGGDEGVEGITLQANHNTSITTGTVSNVASNVVTLTPVTNPSALGEQRPLINTNAAKIYSTGTITGITGTPPTVSGNLTTWQATFGAGAKTNLFFALDADVNGAYKLVVPIRSITNDTTLVLDYVSEGVDAPYPINGSGTYKIYQGSNVTGITWAASGAFTQVTVADGTQFVNADTIEQPLGYATGFVGAHITLNPLIRPGSNTGAYGIDLNNGTAAIAGNSAIRLNGVWANGLQLIGSGFTAGIDFNGAVGASGVGPLIKYDDATNNSVVVLARLLSNASAARNIVYDRANDQWTLGNTAGNFSGADARVAFGTSIQANQAMYLSYSNVAWGGFTISGAGTQNNGVFPFSVNAGGIPHLYTQNSGGGTAYVVVVNNSTPLKFFSGNQATLTAQIDSSTGKASTYASSTTAGNGLAAILGATSQKAESAADANVLTVAPPAAVGTYRLSFVLDVSAATAATLGWTATWKDSNGNAQAPANLSAEQVGIGAPALTFVLASAGVLYGNAVISVDNTATAIVIKLTFAGTSFAAKASATIERLI